MAILMYFRKVNETPATVTYAVSGDPAEPALTLVIDKSADPRSRGEFATRLESAAYRMILAHHGRTGSWPEHGSKQS